MNARIPGTLLFLLCMGAAQADTHVTLPDASGYSYWVQAPAGTVSVAPTNVSGKTQFVLPGSASSGTLYVLDRHNGEVATRPLTGQDQALAVGDFKALSAPATASPATASPATAATPADSKPAPAPQQESGIGRLFTLLFGLIVAGGVGWVIWRLVESRGQPLIHAARRMGIEVPDPAEPVEAESAAPVYTPPVVRPVEKIPEEAGAAPPPRAATAPPRAFGTGDSPQIVGLQGLAAGMVFAVPVGEVSIGRDGDNAIVLAESTVSRLHAKLHRDSSGGITVADAGSANGVFVNGSRVTEAMLTPGDQIQIGDNYFRLDA